MKILFGRVTGLFGLRNLAKQNRFLIKLEIVIDDI